jgi:hypothetical protein
MAVAVEENGREIVELFLAAPGGATGAPPKP